MSNNIVTKTVNYDFIFMGAVHCETLWYWWAKKNALFYITKSALVFLHLYQITLVDDTDSKIAENEQNSKTTKFFIKLFLEESQNNILDINVLENDWSGTKRGMVALLFWQLHVDNC